MLKREYFFAACNNEAYRYREWVINCFNASGVTVSKSEVLAGIYKYPYQLYVDNGKVWFKDESDTVIELEDAVMGEPLYEFKQPVSLAAMEMPNQPRPEETTFGQCYINYLLRVYPFNTRVDFEPGEVKTGTIIGRLLPYIKDDPDNASDWVPGEIYVTHLLKYIEAIMTLVGLVPLAVPSASPRTMTAAPGILEYRNKLLEENKDRLHDPATIAAIDKKLVDYDKKYIAEDPMKGFYYKSKSFAVARKKMYTFHGAEAGFSTDGSIDVVVNSLSEGWDLDKLPAMVNSLRDGSFSRGAETALGGEAVKFFQRVLQNASISEADCGSNVGMPSTITSENASDYVGLYLRQGDGWKSFNDDEIRQFIGQTIEVRSPQFCKTKETDYCRICMGDKKSETPNGLSADASAMGSVFLNTFMKRMHGSALTLARYDYRTSLT